MVKGRTNSKDQEGGQTTMQKDYTAGRKSRDTKTQQSTDQDQTDQDETYHHDKKTPYHMKTGGETKDEDSGQANFQNADDARSTTGENNIDAKDEDELHPKHKGDMTGKVQVIKHLEEMKRDEMNNIVQETSSGKADDQPIDNCKDEDKTVKKINHQKLKNEEVAIQETLDNETTGDEEEKVERLAQFRLVMAVRPIFTVPPHTPSHTASARIASKTTGLPGCSKTNLAKWTKSKVSK